MTSKLERPEDAEPESPATRAEALSIEGTFLRGVPPIAPKALVVDSRRLVKIFVSYAHDDADLKEELLRRLRVRLKASKHYRFHLWDDRKIQPGKLWHEEGIQAAIADCDYGLLLVSYDFLARDYILEHELPYFVSADPKAPARKRSIPVGLKSIAFGPNLELHGLDRTQIFLREQKWFFAEGRKRDEFVDALFERILAIVGEHFPVIETGSADATPPPGSGRKPTGSTLVPTVPSPSALLHQLPAPPPDFVGREEDLKELRRAIRKGGAAICGLQGQGGVGKTALALVLAREMVTDFPAAQIFLDLQGVSDHPLSHADAMAHVVRSFLPDAKVPEGAQLAAVYREVLAGKRSLLLMDNASGREQVVPLVPPEGCALLVTSRQKFTLPGLVPRDLDFLPEKDACELLLAIAPRIGDRAGEIARLCGYLPFALRIAAGTLVERPDLSVAMYEKRLGGEKEKAKLGEGALGLGYTLLPDAFQERFRDLAVFAGDFEAPAAGDVWGLGEEETDESLGAFVRGSLLEGKDGRYKLHDLARAFAASRLGEEEKERVELRHAEYYCGVLAEANRLYKLGNEHIFAGLALFDRERHQIAAGQEWAAEKLAATEEAARLASEYPNAGVYVLNLRLSPKQWIAWLEAGREGARRANDRKMEGRHIGNLGVAHNILGEHRLAIEHLEQQLVIVREIGDRRGEGNALGNLGNAYADLGEPRRAIEHYEQQLAIAREIGDRRGEGNHLGSLGNAYSDLGEPRRAIEYHEQHLAIAREIGDRLGESKASWNLGDEYEKLGELDRAVDLMQVLVDFQREIGHPSAEKLAAEVEAIRARMVGG